jgi:uncharacterized protein (DUF433 family)
LVKIRVKESEKFTIIFLRITVMATVAVDIGTLITQTPELHGGAPHIAHKGVTVRRIVSWYQRGLIPEQIADRIGHLALAEVYAALAYYHVNRTEIDADMAKKTLQEKQLEQQYSQGLGLSL